MMRHEVKAWPPFVAEARWPVGALGQKAEKEKLQCQRTPVPLMKMLPRPT